MATSRLQRFHHVGIAVRDVDSALSFYTGVLGGKLVLYKKLSLDGKFTYTQFELGNQLFELISPAGEGESFLTKFLDKYGEGLHHLTFRVASMKRTVKYLRSRRTKVTGESSADPHWEEAFISPKSSNGVLIQVVKLDD